jgi:Sulfatase-modifying factor enzyme 1
MSRASVAQHHGFDRRALERAKELVDIPARQSAAFVLDLDEHALGACANVWEWTKDWYVAKHPSEAIKACWVPRNPRGPKADESYDPCQPDIKIPRKVIEGGSHLCAPNYCRRFRPAARFPEPVDTSTCHVGFRCIVRPSSTREP